MVLLNIALMTEFIILLLVLSQEPFLLAHFDLLTLIIKVVLALLTVYLQGRESKTTSIQIHFDITIKF